MAGGLNIAAVARRTGVRADTLRKWELRYGVLRPERTSGGQRRYSDRDVARVEWLKARLADGYRIGEAAALLGEGAAPQSPPEVLDELYEAVRRADAGELAGLVEHALSLLPLERALQEVVAPLLRRVGDGWQRGELSVAHEHLVSAMVRAHLGRLLADRRGAVRGVAVLACAPGERHELGLLMLAVVLRGDGWQVAYLGPDTPVAEAAALAGRLDARLLCFSATMREAAAELHAQLDRAAPPERTQLLLGGGALDGETDLRAVVASVR